MCKPKFALMSIFFSEKQSALASGQYFSICIVKIEKKVLSQVKIYIEFLKYKNSHQKCNTI